METQSKIKEAMLYIAKRCQDDGAFGKTRMIKQLFWADALHYALHGKQITNATYRKLPNGPVAMEAMRAWDDLIKEGVATVTYVPTPRGSMQKLTPLKEVTTETLSRPELDLLDYVCKQLEGWTAKAASDHSHDYSPWQWAHDDEEINMNAIFIADRPLSSNARAEALKTLTERGMTPVGSSAHVA